MFLDLGSNLGVYSLLVAELRHSAGDNRAGRVVAVDAQADNLAYISQSLVKNNISQQMVTLVHNAISDVSEPLYPIAMGMDPKLNPGSWQFVSKGEADEEEGEVLGPPTHSITMANLLKGLPSSTFIVKMDIQGMECKALRSLGTLPAATMPYIFMEWNEIAGSPKRCPNLDGFIHQLESAGYIARWPSALAVMPKHCLGAPPLNVLWVHKSARPLWNTDWAMDCKVLHGINMIIT